MLFPFGRQYTTEHSTDCFEMRGVLQPIARGFKSIQVRQGRGLQGIAQPGAKRCEEPDGPHRLVFVKTWPVRLPDHSATSSTRRFLARPASDALVVTGA